MRIEDVEIGLVRARLRRPFVTALGRRTETVNAAITLRLRGRGRGYGEASTSLALKHLSAERLLKTLRALGRRFVGRELAEPAAMIRDAWTAAGEVPPAAAAFESALLSALCDRQDLSLADWCGGKLERARTNLTISADDAAASAAREAANEGFSILKVKLSGRLTEDLARIRAVRAAAPAARLILDGNQGFSEANAIRLVERCLKERWPVDLFEQPTRKDERGALARVARRVTIPIAADESCATPEDAVRLACDGAVRVFNIKLAKSGVLRSLEIAAVARAAKIRLMIGCMAESAAGLSASVHLALGTGFFTWHDLDSDRLLAESPAAIGWRRSGAEIALT